MLLKENTFKSICVFIPGLVLVVKYFFVIVEEKKLNKTI